MMAHAIGATPRYRGSDPKWTFHAPRMGTLISAPPENLAGLKREQEVGVGRADRVDDLLRVEVVRLQDRNARRGRTGAPEGWLPAVLTVIGRLRHGKDDVVARVEHDPEATDARLILPEDHDAATDQMQMPPCECCLAIVTPSSIRSSAQDRSHMPTDAQFCLKTRPRP